MKVSDLQHQELFTAQADESLDVAADRMNWHQVGALPVLEGQHLVGIITERDVTAAMAEGADPVVTPVLRITGVRRPTTNSIEIDWRTEPAPPVLRLEATPSLSVNPPSQWTAVATGAQSTIVGTMSVTGLVSRQFFRLVAP